MTLFIFPKQVDENIKKKEYVRTMRSDFGTSTPEHQIATNIAIMSSVQVTNQATLLYSIIYISSSIVIFLFNEVSL